MATKKDEQKQNIFTKESLKHPSLKRVKDTPDQEFDNYEGRQEAGKFGIKKGRQDDRP